MIVSRARGNGGERGGMRRNERKTERVGEEKREERREGINGPFYELVWPVTG